MKRMTILGATGSIGQSTVDVIASARDRFEVVALTANRDSEKLAAMAVSLGARHAVVADPSALDDLKSRLAGTGITCAAGAEALEEAARLPVDITMAAIVGMAGLKPLMAAIAGGGVVAIANKEPLVAAGHLVMAAARRSGATILPVDSEHNAIFQVFDHARPEGISRIILTASGGPFLGWSAADMARATPAQAVAHPNWSMGAKISVDSATMMNKALEIIEAHHLFSMPPEKIDVLVHPQSIIHSMVEYRDGSVLAQLGAPDMRTPIAYALGWPERIDTPGRRLDIQALSALTFLPPDGERFPFVPMAYACLAAGPKACIALNAANEVAVAEFLAGRIGFGDMAPLVRRALEIVPDTDTETLDGICDFDNTVRRAVKSYIIGSGPVAAKSGEQTAAGKR